MQKKRKTNINKQTIDRSIGFQCICVVCLKYLFRFRDNESESEEKMVRETQSIKL